MGLLAEKLEKNYDTPYRRVSFLGIEETSSAIRTAAEFFENPSMIEESEKISPEKQREYSGGLSIIRAKSREREQQFT